MSQPPYVVNGYFHRLPSMFRNTISADPSSPFPAEKGRYALYVSETSPWAQRATIVRIIKGLEDIIEIREMHNHMTEQGWTFSGEGKSLSEDPDYHFKTLAELYLKVDPNYSGRFSVPVLWDKKTQTIVNNESSDIMRMFTTAFEDLIPQHLREVNRPGGGLYPEPLRQKIDKLNDSMHDILNEGAYKCGLAGTQDAFNANVYPLFRELDRVEAMLAADGRKYLFGDNLTESDIRLYVTIIRFDSVYVPIFQCNLKSIRNDYPAIHLWFRRLYWDKNSDQTLGAFHKTTWPNVTDYSIGYTRGRRLVLLGGQGPCIVPPGPTVLVEPLPKED